MTKQVLNEEEIAGGLDKLVGEILEDNEDAGELVLVGVITRGVTLAERMKKKMQGVNVEIGALDTRPYRDDVKVDEVVEDRTDLPEDLTGKDVIIVDDVMSTGRTMRAALDAVLRYGRPRNVKTAVLINRKHRELPISADYVGAEVLTSVKENIRLKLREVDGGRDRAVIS